MSLHLGLLVHFIFQGAVEDQQVLAYGVETPGLSRCRSLLSRVHMVTINSSKDAEMDHIIRLFTNYQLQKDRNRRRVAHVASRTHLPSIGSPGPNGASTLPTMASTPKAHPMPHWSPSEARSEARTHAGVSFGSNVDDSGPLAYDDAAYASNSGNALSNPYTNPPTAASIPGPSSTTRFKPTPQFTLATEPDLLEPEVDHRPQESTSSAALPLSPDEFNEVSYRTLISQFLTPLEEMDSKAHNIYADYDIPELDSQLDSTTLVDEYNSLSELVGNLVQSLPSFDFENLDQASNSVTQLNKSMLELEAAYLKVARRGAATKAPPVNTPTSLKKSIRASADGEVEESHSDGGDDMSEADFGASLEQEVVLKKYRQRYFKSEWNFISTLTGISSLLKHMAFKTKEQKTKALRVCLQEFNHEFSRGVYMPILRRSGKTYRVIRIPFKEAFTLNSRDRVPYMMFIEAVCDDEQEESPDLQTASHLLHQQQQQQHHSPRQGSSLSNTSPRGAESGLAASNGEFEGLAISAPSPLVSIRDSEDQKVTKSMEKLEIIDEWVVVDKDAAAPEPPNLIDKIYKETWAKKSARVRKASPVGNRKNWELISVVMKSGDDLRQEQLATQLIRLFYDIFQRSGLNLWLYPYEVLAVSSQGGFIETIPDALSIHSIKEELGADTSLRNYFQQAYGARPGDLKKAKLNFIESLAAYSLICYIMQIKDRHNGNIMLDTQGHLIHIDYGFMLTSSPGSLGFENAPFKLTVEFVEVMDGRSSPLYAYFRTLFQSGFLAIRQHYKSIMSIVQMMEDGSKMACFAKGPQTMKLLEDRFKIGLSEEEAIVFADDLITYSEGNWRTDSYDTYQKLTNGILP